MRNILKNLLIGIFYFIVQTTFEILLMLLLIYTGLPYFNMGPDDIFQVLGGLIVYYAISKILYLGFIYLILFTLFSSFFQINYRILNGLLSIGLYVLIMLYYNRNIYKMANPILAICISSIIIYFVFKRIKLINRNS